MFQIPSLTDLTNRARQAFRAYLPGSDAWVWPNNVGPAAKVMAGLVYEVFGFADYIQRQKFAGTADSENLDLHAQEFGLARRPAQPASGLVTLTCTDAVSVSVGALFSRVDGIEYVAAAAAQIGGAGAINVGVTAVTDGTNTNTDEGTALDIVSGVAGDALAVVGSGGIVGGADIEPDGDLWTTDLGTLRGRILFRKRNPPHGGSAADYVRWASEVSGVTRVFVERLWNGPGTVRVFVLMDDLYVNGIPPDDAVLRVAQHIEAQRPAGALVTVAAPTAHPVNVTITGLTPNTVDEQEAVLAELRSAFARLSRVAGIDTSEIGLSYLAYPTSFSRSWIWQAVSNAAGEERHEITVPSADISLASGEIAMLGTVSFA